MGWFTMGGKERAAGQLVSGPGKTGPLESGPRSSWEILAPSTPPQRVLVWRVEIFYLNITGKLCYESAQDDLDGTWVEKQFCISNSEARGERRPGSSKSPPWHHSLSLTSTFTSVCIITYAAHDR